MAVLIIGYSVTPFRAKMIEHVRDRVVKVHSSIPAKHRGVQETDVKSYGHHLRVLRLDFFVPKAES